MSGIYLHIPFCKQACYYCDFHFSTNTAKQEAMVGALAKELRMRKDELAEEEVATIYFGGGTPSLLKIEQLSSLINEVYKNFPVAARPEITLEANPDDLSSGKIKELASSRVNRLSIGVQSFDDQDLKLMNRAHNAGEAITCLDQATKYFDNISVDLIYGIPGMSNARWEKNIDQVLSLGVPHISSYALTVEPGTALKTFIEKGIVPPVDEDKAHEQFHILIEKLEEAGFFHYEISNFGKPGFFSANNTAYWQGKQYLGIGPSAHSYDGSRRAWNVRNNPKYLRAIAAGELPIQTEELSVRDRYNEYVMTGLRTHWGVSLDRIKKDFSPLYADYLEQQSETFVRDGFLRWENEVLLATKKGKFLIDGIAADLFILNLEAK